MEQFFHRGFVPFGYSGFKLLVGRAEPSPPHQVGHQCHIVPLSNDCTS
jgi:hypothetical protein